MSTSKPTQKHAHSQHHHSEEETDQYDKPDSPESYKPMTQDDPDSYSEAIHPPKYLQHEEPILEVSTSYVS